MAIQYIFKCYAALNGCVVIGVQIGKSGIEEQWESITAVFYVPYPIDSGLFCVTAHLYKQYKINKKSCGEDKAIVEMSHVQAILNRLYNV